MARTQEQWLSELEGVLPDWMRPFRPHLAGLAAMLVEVETLNSEAIDATSVSAGTGIWLTLYARGLGVYRQPGESDAELRTRVQDVQDAVTRSAILNAVNALLEPYTAEEAVMYEHFDSGFFLDRDYLDQDDSRFRDEHNAFTLVVPAIAGTPSAIGHYLTADAFATDPLSAYLDNETYLVATEIDETEHAVYAAIIQTVERLRASGIRWWGVRAS